MSHESSRRIREDLELIGRFAHAYRERFSSLITEMNTAPTASTAGEGLRLCVEALNMVLHTQDSLALALRELALHELAGGEQPCQ